MTTFLDHREINCPEIHFAPLQGYTDMAYYSAYSLFFSGVDYFYTPYFSVDDNLSSYVFNCNQILTHRIIPQILPANLDELKPLVTFVLKNSFKEININLGCPYPMVTRKGRGAHLIQHGDIVAEMIDYIHDHSSLEISIKTRIGLTNHSEILSLISNIATREVKSIIVHPRTANQLYKGDVSLSTFQMCKTRYPDQDFIYNGDITDINVFNRVKTLLNNQQKWMIGRGLLSNPLLADQIKRRIDPAKQTDKKSTIDFIKKLIELIEYDSKDKGHALNRIKIQFEYLSNLFSDPQNIRRKIKKVRSIEELDEYLSNEFDKYDV